MTARVVFTAGFSRRYTGGVREFEVEARNLRGVIKAMDQLYPALGHTSKKKPWSPSMGPPRDRLFRTDSPGLRGVLHPEARGRVAGSAAPVPRHSQFVTPGLVLARPGGPRLLFDEQFVDGRNKSGHDYVGNRARGSFRFGVHVSHDRIRRSFRKRARPSSRSFRSSGPRAWASR